MIKKNKKTFVAGAAFAVVLLLLFSLNTMIHTQESPEQGVEEGFSEVVIFAANSVYIKQNATIMSGQVVANNASPGPWLASGVELVVGVSVDTSPESTLYADSIRVKDGAVVSGDVYVTENELVNNGQILGDIFPAMYQRPVM